MRPAPALLAALAALLPAPSLAGGQPPPAHHYTGPQVGQFGEDIDYFGRHAFIPRYHSADQMIRTLKRSPLPHGITRVEPGDDPQYNDVFVTGTWQGVAQLHNRFVALDGPPPRIRIRLFSIDTPMQTIRHLGFNPYNLDTNEMTGQAMTFRLLQAVRQGVLHRTADFTVTPLDGQSARIAAWPPAEARGTRGPSVTYAPFSFRASFPLPINSSGMRVIVTPHVLWHNRFMLQTGMDIPGQSVGSANSWIGNNKPILLGSIATVAPVYKNFRIRMLKTDGVLRLLFGTPTILPHP